MSRPRSTLAQMARRREAALRLYLKGYGVMQITKALGSDNGTISKDLDEIYPGRPRRKLGKLGHLPDPEPVDWRSEPPAAPPELAETVTRSTKSFLAEMASVNYRNAFAHAVTQAVAEDAAAWLALAGRLAADLAAVSDQLTLILSDEEHRQRMAETRDGRDDLEPDRELLIAKAMALLRTGYTQSTIGRRLGLADNSMKLAAIVAVARDRMRTEK